MRSALIFDVDGTLADTERDGHRVAFNRAFADAGLDWNWDVATYGRLLAITGGKERIRHFIETDDPSVPATTDLTDWIAGLHKAKTAHYVAMMQEGRIPLRPGVARLIQEARAAGTTLAIATTTTPENVEALLTATLGEDSPDWFACIAAGDIVPAKKPASDIYDYALAELGIAAGEALALEDSLNGLRSAAGAELDTLITVNDYTRNEDFSGAVAVLDHLGEPDMPCQTLQGKGPPQGHVTLEYLRGL
ncbi:MAG: HAD-IA family hydrolase [Halothiobacillaceae bacterium]